jgi:hypothetical protein
MATLIDAIECWRSSILFSLKRGSHVPGSWQYLDRDVNFWIFGDYDNAPFFSFTRICDFIGLDPVFVRQRLLEWRRKIAEPLTRRAAQRQGAITLGAGVRA